MEEKKDFSQKKKRIKKIAKIVGIIICIYILFRFFMGILFQPSHDRDWELGQEKLPKFTFLENGRVQIENFRNFNWKEEGVADIQYETREFDLKKIETVDVFISHFDDFEGLAHIFVSFGFRNGRHAVISLETRREKDEEFSPLLGIFRQFEIIYVVGSEEDIVGLRTDVRKERVYLYPTKATPEHARSLFLALAQDINDVYDEPRIYNTLTKNCTNEITRRVEGISSIEFPLTWKTILPGYFDEVLYEAGVLNAEGNFSDVKSGHLIPNDRVDRYDVSYSKNIRDYLPYRKNLPPEKDENTIEK
ncbi:MAG: DUF4105 domain-containing protein [Candidatus Moraniibacteriota bacterium]|nr:MAG: DUF4105 domain-containing protein [Candidatus Moranbacteria bacterium]